LLFRDVHQREEENPNNIDKVPIQTDIFHSMPIAAMLDIVLGDYPHDHHSANNVETVEPRCDVIEAPEVTREKRKPMLNLGRVFVGFETHKKPA
jgi:hypothetical protein